jgi:type VI secretion system secreted protein VgrG
MKSAKANQVQFVFLCGTMDAETFSVVDFSGSDKISNYYEYTISLRSANANVSAADVLNKPATFFMFRDGEFYPYSGIVSQFSYVDTSTDYSTYSVVLVPHLWLLNLNTQSRVFQKMSVKDIVKKVLDEGNLADYYTFDLQGTYPEREYVVQYKETDYHFICRLLEEAGIWFFFKEFPILLEELESVGKESLVISDKPDSFVVIAGENEICYRSPSGMFQHDSSVEKEYCNKLSVVKNVTTQNVLVKSYNYRTPEVSLTGQKKIEGGLVGKNYLFGGNFKDTDSAQKSAAILAKHAAMKVSAITGNADCRGFRAGMRFSLTDHAREECNDTYLIVSVAHGGGHASAGGGDRRVTYRNSFSLLPSATIAFFAPDHKHKATPMHGIITAPIEANGSDYASLDESGRYKVRLPFDISDNKNYDASKYVRLAQPYSGANYGMHFPSHEGAEMILACIDGDLDKPLGIGTVPNANTTSPVVSTNKEQNVIRTAGKNEIVMDDTNEKQKIRITTAAKNTVNFDDENKMILVQTTDGNKLLIDDKNTFTTLTAKNHNLTMSYKDGEENIAITSAEGHLIKIDDKEKKLTIQTKAGHIIQLDDDGKKIVLTDCKGKNTVTLDGCNGLAIDSQGKITITAAQDLEIKGANISLEATKGKVTVKASQDVTMSGMNIEGKASVDMKLKGTNVEVAADAQMKIKGGAAAEFASDGMTTVKGGAMLTLKGTMVMIN